MTEVCYGNPVKVLVGWKECWKEVLGFNEVFRGPTSWGSGSGGLAASLYWEGATRVGGFCLLRGGRPALEDAGASCSPVAAL